MSEDSACGIGDSGGDAIAALFLEGNRTAIIGEPAVNDGIPGNSLAVFNYRPYNVKASKPGSGCFNGDCPVRMGVLGSSKLCVYHRIDRDAF